MNLGEMLRYIEAAGDIALKAGSVLLDGLYNKEKIIEFKGDINLVTEMDRQAEEVIKNYLSDRFPDIAMLAEEGGESGNFSGRRWIVDPLDGTTSYAHGLPHFSVSIALEEDAEVVAGVVYNPCVNECFSAVRGGGASLNGQKIKVSATSSFKHSLLATGFPYDRASSKDNNVDN